MNKNCEILLSAAKALQEYLEEYQESDEYSLDVPNDIWIPFCYAIDRCEGRVIIDAPEDEK